MGDLTLLWLLEGLLLLAAVLQLVLARKRGQTLSFGAQVQPFLFPAILLAALVLFQTGTKDVVFPAVMLGLAEELAAWLIRRRKKNSEDTKSENGHP